MVFVFKTSVHNFPDVAKLSPALHLLLGPDTEWNFDLEDIDNIFRVVHSPLAEHEIEALFHRFGFACEALEDVVRVC